MRMRRDLTFCMQDLGSSFEHFVVAWNVLLFTRMYSNTSTSLTVQPAWLSSVVSPGPAGRIHDQTREGSGWPVSPHTDVVPQEFAVMPHAARPAVTTGGGAGSCFSVWQTLFLSLMRSAVAWWGRGNTDPPRTPPATAGNGIRR